MSHHEKPPSRWFFYFYSELNLRSIRKLLIFISPSDVWIRDTPFGPVTDSLKIAEHFDMTHKHVLRAIDKCIKELSIEPKFGLNQNFVENSYLGGAKGRERRTRKVDITEFTLYKHSKS